MTLRAATAKVEITCREEGAPAYRLTEKTRAYIPPHLWEQKIAIADPLYLKTLVLDDGTTRYALLALDTTAIGARTITQELLGDSPDDFMPRIRERLCAEAGIAPEHITASASHTHPPGRLLCSDDEQVEKAVAAVKEALSRLEPVRIGSGSAEQHQLTFNRTLRMKDGTDYTIRGCTPPPPDEEVETLRPIDPEVAILRVDRLDGTPLALVYNFGAHLLLGTPDSHITADFVGVASQHIETVLGHGAMALFLQGGGGDISEITQLDREHPRWGPAFGTLLGESALAAWRKAQPQEAPVRVAVRKVAFPLRTDIPDVIEALRREQQELMASLHYTGLNFKTFLPLYLKYLTGGDAPLHHAYRYLHAEQSGDPGFAALDRRNRTAIAKYLESLRAMERMALNEENICTLNRHREVIAELGTPTVEAEIVAIRVGEDLILTAPMEVLAETALAIKQASPFRQTLVASNTNGYLHYAPPAAYYPRGGYEVTECLLAPEWEALFHRAAEELFAELA